jgi:NAD(P)-dependent dehydrogenase (short-subunit alcohol dehydrogenase family)
MSDRKAPLAGRRALVVGASSGIGRACARRLAVDGAHVTLGARNPEALAQVVEEIAPAAAAAGGALESRPCDAMSADDVRRIVEHAEGGSGLDIAVTIPGGGNYCPVLAYEDDAFGATVDANLRPQFLVLKHAGLAMVRSGGGSIVAISSTASVLSSPYLAAYCAGKAAVDQMARVAADELGRHGIRVNTVRPGLTRTGATAGLFELPSALDRFRVEQPLARGGEPEDIAEAVRFLAGPDSSWVTGQCLTVDGGHTLRRFPDLEPLARQVAGEDVFEAVARGEEPTRD